MHLISLFCPCFNRESQIRFTGRFSFRTEWGSIVHHILNDTALYFRDPIFVVDRAVPIGCTAVPLMLFVLFILVCIIFPTVDEITLLVTCSARIRSVLGEWAGTEGGTSGATGTNFPWFKTYPRNLGGVGTGFGSLEHHHFRHPESRLHYASKNFAKPTVCIFQKRRLLM